MATNSTRTPVAFRNTPAHLRVAPEGLLLELDLRVRGVPVRTYDVSLGEWASRPGPPPHGPWGASHSCSWMWDPCWMSNIDVGFCLGILIKTPRPYGGGTQDTDFCIGNIGGFYI